MTAQTPIGYDRDALVAAIDSLHEATFETHRPEARRVAGSLGWDFDTHPEGPDGEWLRHRLYEVIR